MKVQGPWKRLPGVIIAGLGIFGVCGLGFWWLEPNVRSWGDGLWLAFTTAATVGYGDIVPSTPASKVFAVFVVLLGLALLSLVTASIAALWVQTEERRIEREILNDLHREMRQVRVELAELRSGGHGSGTSSPSPARASRASVGVAQQPGHAHRDE